MTRYVLFLDFDGVLHPDEQRFTAPFCFMDNFCEAIRDADIHRRIEIVISSTWRLRHTLDDLTILFPMDIATRIVGVTPSLREVPEQQGRRQREIEAWMSAVPDGKWLAIDDKPGLFDPDCANLFQVPYSDPTLVTDLAAANHPLSGEMREMFLKRKRANRSIGLNPEQASRLTQRLGLFLGSDLSP